MHSITTMDNFMLSYNLSLSEEEINLIMANIDPYVCYNQEEFECAANKLLFFLRHDIQEIIFNNSLIDPCNPDMTSKDIFNTYANSNCSENLGTKTLDKILNEIGKGGGKMNKTESFLQCKALNCLFDALWDQGTTNFCELQDNFESDSKIIDITIGSEDKFLNTSDRAYVSIDQVTGRITMYFNPKFCVPRFDIETTYPYADFISSAKTIIHESIHADYLRQASTLLPDGKTLYPIDGVSWIESVRKFLNIICTDGDNITDQHEAMMTFWVDKIAKDLWEFNNKIGTWEDYLYLAWQGIVTDETNISDPCMLLFINQSEFNKYHDNYLNNVVDNPETIKNQKVLNDCINE